jgi:hypothetical protein
VLHGPGLGLQPLLDAYEQETLPLDQRGPPTEPTGGREREPREVLGLGAHDHHRGRLGRFVVAGAELEGERPRTPAAVEGRTDLGRRLAVARLGQAGDHALVLEHPRAHAALGEELHDRVGGAAVGGRCPGRGRASWRCGSSTESFEPAAVSFSASLAHVRATVSSTRSGASWTPRRSAS